MGAKGVFGSVKNFGALGAQTPLERHWVLARTCCPAVVASCGSNVKLRFSRHVVSAAQREEAGPGASASP